MDKRLVGIALIIVSLILFTSLFLIKSETDSWGLSLCELVASNPTVEMNQCPVHSSNIPLYLTLGYIMGFIVLVAGVYLVIPQKKQLQEKKAFKSVDVSSLDEEEKKVYSLLKDNEGHLYQSNLVKKTEYSKVKITRILDRMESKGLIDRKRRGMTNIVVLR